MTAQEPAESWLAAATDRRFATFMPCGTAALELALQVAGAAGREVVIPAECCTVILGAVVRVGAQPVLAGVDSSCLVTPASVAATIGRRTAAVVAVHQWGRRLDCGPIRAVLPSGVTLIEDAAPYWDPTFPLAAAASDAVILSFGPDKPLTLGGGGALCADDEAARVLTGLAGPPLFERDSPFVPTAVLPPPAVRVLRDAAAVAERALHARRELADRAHRLLSTHGGEVLGGPAPDHCWQAFPMVLPTTAAAVAAARSASEYAFVARTLSSRPLVRSPLARAVGIDPDQSDALGQIQSRVVVLEAPSGFSTPNRLDAWLTGAVHEPRKGRRR